MSTAQGNNDDTTTTTPTNTVQIRGMNCVVHQWNVNNETSTTTPPKALAIIFHGFGAHGKYPTVGYAAEFLAADGYAVIAVDMPGHGKSPGLRGYLESADTVIEDGMTIVQYARNFYSNHNKDLKILLVGSSMGGAIALSVAQSLKKDNDNTNVIAGVVLLAPMLKLNVGGLEYAALKGLSYIAPTLALIPSSATDPAKQYRDEKKRQECQEDPLSFSGNLRVASALTCVEITMKIQNQFDQIEFPFLLLIADEDVVVKNQGSEELYNVSPSKHKTKKNYPALHGLLCEPSPLFDEIKNDMLSWMNQQL